MILDLLSTLIHLYCFCLFLRLLFHAPQEMFFNPMLAGIKRITDPVLDFFINKKIWKIRLNPWIPIMCFLLIKSLLYRSVLDSPISMSLQTAFMASVLEFFSFLYKTTLFMFWMVYSADRYHIYDDIFNVMALICNKILSWIPLSRQPVSVRNHPPQAFAFLLILFFICFAIINAGILLLQNAFQENIFKELLRLLSFLPLKIIAAGILEMLALLPFFIFIRILISWFMPPVTRVLLLLHAATEPILEPFRRLNLVVGMLDLSPLVAFFVLEILISFLNNLYNKFF